nr:sodium-dependent high-affinity dicarboxylate transporter 3-like [Rhipicephalus microplus]
MASPDRSSQKQQALSSFYNKFLTCLGATSPILLCPLLFEGSKESRCGFCISTVSILLLAETLPAPITALLPLLLFTDLGLADDACLHMSAFSKTLLMVLGEVMMVFLLCLTSVYQRVSLLLLEAFGARLHVVALICMTAALLTPFIVHDTLAALLVLSLVRRLVADYMSEGVQQTDESFASYIEDVVEIRQRSKDTMADADKIKHMLKAMDDGAFQMFLAKNPSPVLKVVSLCQSYDKLKTNAP